jgi:carboxyl-terminal processing protease
MPFEFVTRFFDRHIWGCILCLSAMSTTMHPAQHLCMRNLLLRSICLGVTLVFATGSSLPIAVGQTATLGSVNAPVAAQSEHARTQSGEGKRLEQERRWQEAILLYEKLVKKDGRLKECNERLQICRVHFDVTRRYSDRSFMQTVDSSSASDAFQVLTEVLTKLDVYYVEQVDYYKLALHGTAFLEVALTEQDFVGRYLQHADGAAVESFRKNIHKAVFGRKIQSAEELKSTIAYVANTASQQIGLSATAVIYEYIAGSVGLLDPYSALLTPGEYREVMSQIDGNLIGLGVELWAEGAELRIVDVFKGGPAHLAGVVPNQYILQVDDSSVQEIGAKKAADLLRGPEGSTVRLVVRNIDDQLMNLQVQRKRVDVPSVSLSEMVDKNIGYIKITNFQKTTASEVSRAMMSLSREGMQSVIIDLRRNPGGLLDAAVELADQFIARGGIVSTVGRNGQESHNFTATAPAWDLPLVVLIDGDSASASEIFAGAIHDHQRGTIVGQTSYGKGSVQGVFHNEHGNGGLRLTVSKFFSPNGTPISARGVQPDVAVVEDESSISTIPTDSTVPAPTSIDSKRFIAKQDSSTASKPATESRGLSKSLRQDNAKLKAIEVAKQKVNFAR